MPSTAPDAAAEAAALLKRELAELIGTGQSPVRLRRSTAARDWSLSGAMALTGQPDGPVRLAPGGPASWMRAAAALAGTSAALPDPAALLGERAACSGLGRRGPRSVGGAFRSFRTADGWLGMSLARPDDFDRLPALIEADIEGDPWRAVQQWLTGRPAAAAAARAQLLGLPAAKVATAPAPATRPAVKVQLGGPAPGRRARPMVVDLSALWAGPLCAHLLGLTGARVIKVESSTRPDGARRGAARFYDLLHAGHESVALDFGEPAGRQALQDLVGAADVVVEASRPRALQQLGLDAAGYVAAGTVWVAVSAYGREQPLEVGFGDDVAAAAGLVVNDGDGPYPVGDAIGDPLAGATAAAAVSVALRASCGCLLDVSMHAAAANAARLATDEAEVVRRDGAWWADCQRELIPVGEPRARRGVAQAPAMGAHTSRVLTELRR
jgi:hypothetical protein